MTKNETGSNHMPCRGLLFVTASAVLYAALLMAI